jgi:peroxiredoxin
MNILLSENDKPFDSAIVINGRFKFIGSLYDSLTLVKIRSASLSADVSFWLDKTSVKISINDKNFTGSQVLGSALQSDQAKVDSFLNQLGLKRDSLAEALKKGRLIKLDYSNKTRELDRIKYETIVSFVKRNKASLASVFFLWKHAQFLTGYLTVYTRYVESLGDLYFSLPEKVANSQIGKQLCYNFILAKGLVKSGDKFIDFSQPDSNGNLITLSNLRYDLMLLEFWASGCGPCRISNPELVKIYEDFKEKGFEILSVSLDRKKEDWLKAIEKDGLAWPQVCDFKAAKNDAVLKYGVLAVPMNFLINREGIIIDMDLANDRLKEKLEKHFAQH